MDRLHPWSRRVDWWPATFFCLHVGQALALRAAYPHLVYDTDLLAYLVYFRSWVAGQTLDASRFFTVPKPLLVFGLGPLGRPELAFVASAVASGFVGALAYLYGRRVFGRSIGLLLAACLLLDVEKATLAVKSKADLYVGAFFLLALYRAVDGRVLRSSLGLLLSALVKPVTLPCALAYLAMPGPRRERWLATLVPFVAIPLTLAGSALLFGDPFGAAQCLAGFGASGDASPIGAGEVLHFALWTDLARHAFGWTAALGIAGFAGWLARDRARLSSPVCLMPLGFLVGWVALAVGAPFAPFFRFFWPVQVWFLGFVLAGARDVAAMLAARSRALAAVAMAAAVTLLAQTHLRNYRAYRDGLARPFETAMASVSRAVEVLRRERRAGDTVSVPYTFLPYVMSELGLGAPDVILAERATADAGRPPAEWVLYLPPPGAPSTAGELADVAGGAGYRLRAFDGTAALLELRRHG